MPDLGELIDSGNMPPMETPKVRRVNANARLWLHVPVGIATVLGLWVHPALGIVMCLTFLSYQWIEDWRIKDFSFLDKAGYSWGLFCGAVLWIGLVAVGLIPATLGGGG